MKLLGVEQVKELLQVKNSKAYDIIRQLNAELTAQGYLTVKGRVPEKYLMERFYF